MTVPKQLEETTARVPAPISFGDEPALEGDRAPNDAFAGFSDVEITAPQRRPDGWASLAERRSRSLSSEPSEQ